MACTTCIRWMVWNESDRDQIFYYYDCNDGTTLLSAIVGSGQFYSVCGCQQSGSYSTSDDVYIENGGTGYINYNGILLYPCELTPSPSITPSQFPTRTPNHTPTPTPILCGSGVTTTNSVYYTDCCGNFITTKAAIGTVIIFDYTQPYNGITKLNAPATTSCPTPTPTKTPTRTPTQTPTVTLTPTHSSTPNVTPTVTPTTSLNYEYSLKNDCDVLTLFDMGVQCNPIQLPSNQYSNDGVLSLNVTGGTSPYSYYWSGGQRSRTLVGIPEGSYQVTVVDYYGDYSSTTICNLFAPSQTPTLTITPTPTITPSPVWPSLCFTYTDADISYGPIQFIPSGNMNGKPTWTATYQSVTLMIIWSSTTSRWQMSGWSFTSGIPVSTNQTNTPTGNWTLYGGNKGPILNMTQGICPTTLPLSIAISKQDTTCPGFKDCNGSITVATYNGVPPYSYSINNGITYQSSNIFQGLCANVYTVIVQDSGGNTLSSGVNIAAASTASTYNIKVQLINDVSYSIDNEVATWKVDVTPALPVGTSISFKLNINTVQDVDGPGGGIITNTTTVNKNGTILIQPSITSSTQTTLRANCSPYTQVETTKSQVYNLTIGHGDVISGTSSSQLLITTGITGSNGCITKLVQTILVSTSQPTILGKTCSVVVNNPTGQGVVSHNISSATSTNPISLRTLTGTTICSGATIGVYGKTGLTTLYTNASPGFVDGATVYTDISLTNLVPDGVVFRYPNNTNSTVYLIIGNGEMNAIGAYGGPC